MAKKVISIETGIWWTKVAVVDAQKKNPQVYEAFTFRTPEHAIEDGYIRDKEGFAKCLKEQLASHQVVEKNVLFSINSSKVITREISIPYVKDKQIAGIVEAQAREHFPMDVSNYTISFRKMDVVEGENGKAIKLLLIAVPDNLLANYTSFATNAGFTIDTFEYIGNSAVSFMNSNFSDNSVIVQLEEQATIISMVSNKKLVFQRVAPYGYGTSLAAVLDHPVLGAKDEYEAFQFLNEHDVLNESPRAAEFTETGIEEIEKRQELLEEAYADIKEALSYHIRVVYTALDYYKNQSKGEFQGKLHLIGDGVRFAGIKKMFMSQIPLQFESMDYNTLIHHSKGGFGALQAVTYLSVIGAAIHPIDIKPKDLKEREKKKNDLYSSYVILAASALISVILILTGTIRQFVAVSEQKRLEKRIDELSYIEQIYAENEEACKKAEQFMSFDELTQTKNEGMTELLESLENELPTPVTVQSMAIVDDSITLNVTCDYKLTAAQMLMNLADVPFLGNISIPSMTENDDATGGTVWQFTITANYVEPPVETETAVETDETTETNETVETDETTETNTEDANAQEGE